MTLQETKDHYAKESMYSNWNDFKYKENDEKILLSMDEIALRYATACCKATLEKAAEFVELGREGMVTDPNNIVIL